MTKAKQKEYNIVFEKGKVVLLTDSLLYGVAFDPSRSEATVTVEIDPLYHKSISSSLELTDREPVLIELIMRGVRKLTSLGRVAQRPSIWKEDEKPHNCEIGSFLVRAKFCNPKTLQVRLGIFNGPRLVFHCEEIVARQSCSEPGYVHDYD